MATAAIAMTHSTTNSSVVAMPTKLVSAATVSFGRKPTSAVIHSEVVGASSRCKNIKVTGCSQQVPYVIHQTEKSIAADSEGLGRRVDGSTAAGVLLGESAWGYGPSSRSGYSLTIWFRISECKNTRTARLRKCNVVSVPLVRCGF